MVFYFFDNGTNGTSATFATNRACGTNGTERNFLNISGILS